MTSIEITDCRYHNYDHWSTYAAAKLGDYLQIFKLPVEHIEKHPPRKTDV